MDYSFSYQQGASTAPKLMVDDNLETLIILNIIDTGCDQKALKAELVTSQLAKEDTPVSLMCMHRETFTYQKRKPILTFME